MVPIARFAAERGLSYIGRVGGGVTGPKYQIMGGGRTPTTTASKSAPTSTSGGGTGGADVTGIKDLLDMFTSQYEESRAAKQARYEKGVGILEEVAGMFGPGYLKGEEMKTLAAMEQGMVGRGLGGTTRPAAVGAGIKADIRDRATKGRVGAMTNIANFMAGFQDIYPQPSTLAGLTTSMANLSRPDPVSGGVWPQAPAGGPTYMANAAAKLTDPTQLTGPTTGPGPGVASATVGFGPSAPSPGVGAGAATYGVSGGLTPAQQQAFSTFWWKGVQS